MEGKIKQRGIGELQPVNIPIQMICGTDTTGKITPIRFRFQTVEDSIETIDIQKVVSRDERNYLGIEYYPPWEPPVSRLRATRKFLP